MALTSGFFNSNNGDRKYYAEQFGNLFDGILKDGVFLNVGNHFQVTANGGRTIAVGTGRAWFNGTWTNNSSASTLTHAVNDTLLDRIDAVVLDVDKTTGVRANTFKIVEGPRTKTARPTLIKEEDHVQYPLAYVLVGKQSANISQGNITNMIGTSDCPFASGVMSTIDATSLYNQWASQFASFLSNSNTTFDTFMTESDTEFTTWFDSLEAVFSETEYQNIMNRVVSVARVRQGTFTANGWAETASGSQIFTQTININGMSEDYNPILVGMIASDATVESATKYNQAFARLVQGRGVTAEGTVTWYCYGAAPDIDITVGFKGE